MKQMFLKKITLSEWLLLSHMYLFNSFINHTDIPGKKVMHLGIIADSSNYQSKTHYLPGKEKPRHFEFCRCKLRCKCHLKGPLSKLQSAFLLKYIINEIQL